MGTMDSDSESESEDEAPAKKPAPKPVENESKPDGKKLAEDFAAKEAESSKIVMTMDSDSESESEDETPVVDDTKVKKSISDDGWEKIENPNTKPTTKPTHVQEYSTAKFWNSHDLLPTVDLGKFAKKSTDPVETSLEETKNALKDIEQEMNEIEAKAKADLAQVILPNNKDGKAITGNSNNNNNSHLNQSMNIPKVNKSELIGKISSEFDAKTDSITRSGSSNDSLTGSTLSFANIVGEVMNSASNSRSESPRRFAKLKSGRKNRKKQKAKKGVLRLKEAAARLSRESSFVNCSSRSIII